MIHLCHQPKNVTSYWQTISLNLKKNIYQQTRGTAMGTRSAQSLANLYMCHFEENHIYNNHNWFSNIIFLRYIDHIIIICNGTFENITKHLNNNTWGLQFTSSHLTEKKKIILGIQEQGWVCFNGNIFKPVESKSYIDFMSLHHKKTSPTANSKE